MNKSAKNANAMSLNNKEIKGKINWLNNFKAESQLKLSRLISKEKNQSILTKIINWLKMFT